MSPSITASDAYSAYLANPNKCLTCGKQILSCPSGQLSELRGRKFCDKSCAAVFNNRSKPKRKRIIQDRSCRICGAAFDRSDTGFYTRSFCKDCGRAGLANVLDRLVGTVSHPQIREYARKAIAHVPKVCAGCGYDRHVEVSHIRPVAEFPATATLREVNYPANLRWMCRNCHWEIEHGKRGRDGSRLV